MLLLIFCFVKARVPLVLTKPRVSLVYPSIEDLTFFLIFLVPTLFLYFLLVSLFFYFIWIVVLQISIYKQYFSKTFIKH